MNNKYYSIQNHVSSSQTVFPDILRFIIDLEYLPDIIDELYEFRSDSNVKSVLNLPANISEFAAIVDLIVKINLNPRFILTDFFHEGFQLTF
jgi:hypothetical protein